tara:strand:- start:53 stop:409 length:357 start_codon:yes stop_codon:yes gene_type:complete
MNIDTQNPYANVDDTDYFSKKSHKWAKETPEAKFEAVANAVADDATDPQHYNTVPEHLQHWDVVPQMGWDYHIGCATKYIWRAGKKKSAGMDDKAKEIQDLEKAVVYINKKIEILRGN